jgi:hypothetical protein
VAWLPRSWWCGQRNPIYSAFAMIVTFCALSAIYGLMGSPFIAVLQIVVYAGAIMVLFLFVLMLLNVQREEGPRRADACGLPRVSWLSPSWSRWARGERRGPGRPAAGASTPPPDQMAASSSRRTSPTPSWPPRS